MHVTIEYFKREGMFQLRWPCYICSIRAKKYRECLFLISSSKSHHSHMNCLDVKKKLLFNFFSCYVIESNIGKGTSMC